jgi:3-keto-disaccharide hydrolase
MRTTACAAALVAAMTLCACTGMPATSTDAGWVVLLDGAKGFEENWTRIGAANWRIVDGVAQADTGEKGKNSFLMTKQAYGDFLLRAQLRPATGPHVWHRRDHASVGDQGHAEGGR